MKKRCLRRIIFGVILLFALGLVPGKLNTISDKMILTVKAEETLTITFKSEEGYILGEKDKKEYSCQIAKGLTVMANSNFMSTGNRPGYVLVGWKIEGGDDKIYNVINGSNGAMVENIMMYAPEEDTTFIAQWAEACTISFYSDKGLSSQSDYNEITQVVEKGVRYGLNHYYFTLINDEYVFSGWKIEGDETLYTASELENFIPQKDTIFIAQWEEAWKVIFHTDEGCIHWEDNGKESMDFKFLIKKGEKINKNGLYGKREGYVFEGWKIEGEDKLYSEEEDGSCINDYVPEKDVTFVPQWAEAYKLTFKSGKDGLEYGDDVERLIKKNSKIDNTPAFACRGYALTGWKLEGSDKVYKVDIYNYEENGQCINDYIPKGDDIFVGQWEEAYNVNFYSEEGRDYDDGDHSDFDEEYAVVKGKHINIYPEIQRIGYTLVGWKIEGDNTLYVTDPDSKLGTYIRNYTPVSDVTFIAQWSESQPGDSDDKQDDNGDENSKQEQEQKNQKTQEKQQDEKKENSNTDSSSITGGDSENGLANDVIKEYSAGDTATDNGIKYTVGDDATVTYISSEDNTLTTVTIPDTINLNGKEYKVTDVAEGSFRNNTNLKSVTIGTNVHTIGKNAYSGCKNLTTITVKGSSLETIEVGAFQNCKKLKKITLNKNVKTIGNNAFSGDKDLKTIVIKSTKIKRMGKNAFKNISKKATIYVPKTLTKKQLAKYKKMIKQAGVAKSVKIKKK